MSVRNILFQHAAAARQFLEPIWPEWQAQTCQKFGGSVPHIMSAGTCGRSSTFLAAVMNQAGIEAQVEHGWFCKIDPATTEADNPLHAWVTAGGWVIDITADQFGAPPILVTKRSDRRYKQGRDTADETARARRFEVLAKLWNPWLRGSSTI